MFSKIKKIKYRPYIDWDLVEIEGYSYELVKTWWKFKLYKHVKK